MKYFALTVFLVSTVFHLYASKVKNQKLRNITKPFILTSLLAFYCLCSNAPSMMIIIALLLSWLGDVLLIPHGLKWFTAGGISFLFSHVFFILGYNQLFDIRTVPALLLIILTCIYATAVVIIFKNLKQYLPKPLFYPMFLYLLINGMMNCFALLRLYCVPCFASLVTYIGALMFFVSDSSLFFVRFNKDGKLKTHFLVMLTYSLGEFLIIAGLLL